MKRIVILILIFLSVFISSCVIINKNNPVITITIDISDEKQEIYGFGASDCWGCQFTGKFWPLEKREQIADWLFSTDTLEAGQPKGIGLSIWRFNIGGGTTEQGDSSFIRDEWRRAECFMNPDGSFNPEKQQGQQWFLQAAKKRGTENFIAFSNTPPVYLTKNGKGWSSGGNSVNLKPENYHKYAVFLTSVLKYFESQNIHFNMVSPFNEPQWNWDGKGQEGTPCKNSEIYQVVTELDKSLSENGLKTKIEVTEAGQIDYLFKEGTQLTDRDNQIFAFFYQQSPFYLGNLTSVSRSIAGHSYFSTFDTENMKKTRTDLYNKIQETDKNLMYNMTEYCVLENNIEIKGRKRDLGMKTALYVAKVIHYDMTVANASSWQWWTAVSPYDYKDGLVYTDMDKTDGNIYDSKLLWAFGHYSFFIRPGMTRVESSLNTNITCKNGEEGLLVSSYKTKDDKKMVSVLINLSDDMHNINLDLKTKMFRKMKIYLTNENETNNIIPVGIKNISETIEIPAKSIVTLEFI